jgi:hypothetical protein
MIKDIVRKMMVSLHNLVEYASNLGVTSHHIRGAANTHLVGILWWNCFAGRSGDWQKLKAAHVVSQLVTKGLDFIEFTEYKTAKFYGDLGKWVPAGTVAAILKYMQLPGDDAGDSGKFLRAARGAEVPIATCLKRVGLLYSPDYQAPGVNLIRKLFHTKLMDMTNNDEIIKLISRVDRHSEGVAARVYVTKDPEGDAKLGELLFKAVLGEPVPWPSEGELRAGSVADDLLVAQAWRIEKMPEFDEVDDIPEVEIFNSETTLQPIPLHDMGGAAASGDSILPYTMDADAVLGPEEQDAAGGEGEGEGEAEIVVREPETKRGRKTIFTPEQKKWIIDSHRSVYGAAATNVAPNIFLREILKEGLDSGALPPEATTDKVRNVIRGACREA